MIALSALLARYGPLAIALGAGLEGETAVLTGGVLAGRGVFPPAAAFAAAFAGSALADQLLFLAGRRGQTSRFVARVRARPAFARVLRWVEARPVPFIIGFRFAYGCRVAGPVALGMSAVPARRFVPLNLLAAAIWAGLFTWLGWRFGARLVPLLGHAIYQLRAPLGLLVAGGIVAGLAVWLRRQSRQS